MDKRQNTENWVEYWKKKDAANETMSRLNMDIFLRATGGILRFNARDIVLDIGCGYCNLAEALKEKVSEIHCVDISDFYLERGRAKFKENRNVSFYKLKEENYTRLDMLEKGVFTKIVCLSVVQYYRDIKEVEELIKEVRKAAKAGAKFIIGDIPIRKVGYADSLETLRCAARVGRLFEACLHFTRGWAGDYRRVNRNIGLLYLTREQLCQMGQRVGINVHILDQRLTINPNRVHLLIEF